MAQMELELDFEPDRIADHYIVTESNALIEARTGLDLYEERLIYILASKINPEDTHFRTCFFSVKQIAETLDLTEKNFYKRVKDIIDRLQHKQVIIEEQATNSTLKVNWLSASRYYHGKGIIELEFSQLLGPYLLQLKNNFTNYKLWNVLYLKSFYSSKLYKLLKQYLPLGKRKFSTLAELKEKLEIEEGKYALYSHLKNRILLNAQRELEEKTDIKFTIEEVKTGNKVVGVTFHIFHNNRIPRIGINDSEYIDNESIYELLSRFEINKKMANELINSFGESHIRNNIKYVYEKKQNAEIANLSGYIVKAIKENYAASEKEYTPDNEDDKNTSILMFNQRVKQIIAFYEQCVAEGIKTKYGAEKELVEQIIKELQLVITRRSALNMRPVSEDDLIHPIAREAFLLHM